MATRGAGPICIGWGSLPPPVHGTSIMNEVTRKALAAHGNVIWLDPSGVSSTCEMGGRKARQTIKAIKDVLRLVFVLSRWRAVRVYLSVGVVGAALWRDCAAWSIAVILSKKMPVVHLHTGNVGLLKSGKLRKQITAWLTRESECWFLSEKFLEELQSAGVSRVVNNGVTCGGRRHGELGRLPRREDGTAKVLFLSNRIKAKGVETAISACRRVLVEDPGGYEVVFAGTPMDDGVERSLARLMSDYPGDVRVYDSVGADLKCELLSAADVMLFPSRHRLEGVPLVVIEALSHGLYCIVSNHAGLPEMVGDVGMVADSEEEIVESIRAFRHSDLIQREAKRQKSRERWMERYTEAGYRDRVCELVLGQER